MEKEKRQALRTSGDLTVNCTLRDSSNGKELADSLPGHLKNVSLTGASLSVNHIRTGGYHLFYAAKDSDKPILFIESLTSPSPEDSFSIPVKPIWFNCEGFEESTTFKMGVEFMESSDSSMVKALVRKACGTQGTEGGWFKNFLSNKICAFTRNILGPLIRRH